MSDRATVIRMRRLRALRTAKLEKRRASEGVLSLVTRVSKVHLLSTVWDGALTLGRRGALFPPDGRYRLVYGTD